MSSAPNENRNLPHYSSRQLTPEQEEIIDRLWAEHFTPSEDNPEPQQELQGEDHE